MSLPFPPLQTHRKSWSDHQHLAGTADPSQEYNLRDLSSSKDERIRQTLNLVERMPAALTFTAFDIYASLVLILSSKSSSSCPLPAPPCHGLIPLWQLLLVLALASS